MAQIVPTGPFEPLVKSQTVRKLDVWVIGPLMVWGGLAVAGRNPRTCRLAGLALAAFGVSTVIYNYRNHRHVAAWQRHRA